MPKHLWCWDRGFDDNDSDNLGGYNRLMVKIHILTKDGNEWIGQLQKGWFTVGSLRCEAENVSSLSLSRAPTFGDIETRGDLYLADGTHLYVPRCPPGILFWKDNRYEISGEVTILLASLDLAKTFLVTDIERLYQD